MFSTFILTNFIYVKACMFVFVEFTENLYLPYFNRIILTWCRIRILASCRISVVRTCITEKQWIIKQINHSETNNTPATALKQKFKSTKHWDDCADQFCVNYQRNVEDISSTNMHHYDNKPTPNQCPQDRVTPLSTPPILHGQGIKWKDTTL